MELPVKICWALMNQLTNYNVEAECTPSRTALMTGRYGARTRLRPEGPPRSLWYGISKWEITLAEMLSDSGYTTGIFGKWHLGDTEGRYPTDQGFDEWYGIPNSSDRAFWPDSDSFQKDPGVGFTYITPSTALGARPKPRNLFSPISPIHKHTNRSTPIPILRENRKR